MPLLKETLSNPRKYEMSKSKLAMSLDYIFGRGTSRLVDFEKLDFQYSRRTGRLRYVTNRESDEILFTFRANGSIAPTIKGASMMLRRRSKKSKPRWIVTVIDGVSEFIASGKTVFCKHVAKCDENLKAGEDVVVLNQKGRLLAVGRSVVPGFMMKQFKKGVAVKVREGVGKDGSTIV